MRTTACNVFAKGNHSRPKSRLPPRPALLNHDILIHETWLLLKEHTNGSERIPIHTPHLREPPALYVIDVKITLICEYVMNSKVDSKASNAHGDANMLLVNMLDNVFLYGVYCLPNEAAAAVL
jgi:hypothetical protein